MSATVSTPQEVLALLKMAAERERYRAALEAIRARARAGACCEAQRIADFALLESQVTQ